MSTLFTQSTDDASGAPHDGVLAEAGRIDLQQAERAVDSNAVRWVLAATLAFWLAIYAAGSRFF